MYLIKVLPVNIKWINSMQKYSHIINFFPCFLNMFVFMLLCLINIFVRNMFNLKTVKLWNIATYFSKIWESSWAWTIFMMPFISSFGIIELVVPEPCIFFWIHASIAEAAAVFPNGTKIFFAKGTATFINGPDNLL